MSAEKLPEGWSYTEIGNVADIISGGTPKSGVAENFAPSGEGIAWLTPADLSGYKNKYISRGARDLSKAGYDSCSAKVMPMGSILFSSRAPIGYVAIASNEISTNQGFKSFVFASDIYSGYAYYYMCSIKHLAEEMGTGTTFKEISGSSAKNLPFSIAPLAEQKIIAEKLDTLLAQVDSTKARLEQIPKILKRFRQAVLTEAVSGKKNHSESSIKKLSDISKFQNGYAFKSSWFAKEGPYQVIKLANIRDGYLFLENAPSYVNDEIGREFSKFSPEKGDILIGMTGTRFKRDYGFSCLNTQKQKLLINQRVGRIIPLEDKISSEYLSLFVRSALFREQFFKGETGGVNQGNVGSQHIASITLSLPPMQEQHEIVRRVEQLFAYADTIEKQVNTALSRVNHLTQSILAKAFRGELTAQWREENPDLISGENSAAALLEKIKAERAASGGKKASRKKG